MVGATGEESGIRVNAEEPSDEQFDKALYFMTEGKSGPLAGKPEKLKRNSTTIIAEVFLVVVLIGLLVYAANHSSGISLYLRTILNTFSPTVSSNVINVGVDYSGHISETNYGKVPENSTSYDPYASYRYIGVSSYDVIASFYKNNSNVGNLYYNGQYYIAYSRVNNVGRLCVFYNNASGGSCLNETYSNVSSLSLFYNSTPADFLNYLYKLSMRDFLSRVTTLSFGLPVPTTISTINASYKGQACKLIVKHAAGTFAINQNLGVAPPVTRTVTVNLTIAGCVSNNYNIPLNGSLTGTASFADPAIVTTLGYSETSFNITADSNTVVTSPQDVSNEINNIQYLINEIR